MLESAACGQMPAKRIWRERTISITACAITKARLPKWKWRGAVYPMIRASLNYAASFCADGANGKRERVIWSEQSNLIRATFIRSNSLPSATMACGAIQRRPPSWIVP